jgi:hypothetical protein
MNNQNQQLDPSVVALAKAIGMTESKGNYNARGKSGEFGAYQYTAPTWQQDSIKYLGQAVPLEQATPAQQDEVAYKKIQDLGKQGFNPSQIASIWNSGKPDWEGNVGTNSYGVHFDTPQYVKSVGDAYQQIMQGNQNPTLTPNASSVNQEDQSDGLTGISGIDKVIDFLFPVASDIKNDFQGKNSKTALQQAGDLGLSILPFIPGLGEAGEGARAGSLALKGAALGYGAGALSNLSQGKSVGESLAPSVTNLLGAATGGITNVALPKLAGFFGKNLTEHGATDAVKAGIAEELARTSPSRQLLGKMGSEDADRALSLISRVPEAIPEVAGNSFDVEPAIEALEKRIAKLGAARSSALDSIGAEVPIDEIMQNAIKKEPGLGTIDALTGEETAGQLNRSAFSGKTSSTQAKVESLLSDIKQALGKETLSPSELEILKEEQARLSGRYRLTGDVADENAHSMIADAARNKLEKLAEDSGFSGMKEYNRYIKDHYNAIKLLQRLGKQTVKGGRLGNMLRSHALAGVMSVAANAGGGGFLGTLMGGLAGETAGQMFSKILADTSISNPLRDKILEKIAQEDPQVVQELLAFAKKGTGKVAPMATPKAASVSKGILPNLVTKTAIRGATNTSIGQR